MPSAASPADTTDATAEEDTGAACASARMSMQLMDFAAQDDEDTVMADDGPFGVRAMAVAHAKGRTGAAMTAQKEENARARAQAGANDRPRLGEVYAATQEGKKKGTDTAADKAANAKRIFKTLSVGEETAFLPDWLMRPSFASDPGQPLTNHAVLRIVALRCSLLSLFTRLAFARLVCAMSEELACRMRALSGSEAEAGGTATAQLGGPLMQEAYMKKPLSSVLEFLSRKIGLFGDAQNTKEKRENPRLVSTAAASVHPDIRRVARDLPRILYVGDTENELTAKIAAEQTRMTRDGGRGSIWRYAALCTHSAVAAATLNIPDAESFKKVAGFVASYVLASSEAADVVGAATGSSRAARAAATAARRAATTAARVPFKQRTAAQWADVKLGELLDAFEKATKGVPAAEVVNVALRAREHARCAAGALVDLIHDKHKEEKVMNESGKENAPVALKTVVESHALDERVFERAPLLFCVLFHYLTIRFKGVLGPSSAGGVPAASWATLGHVDARPVCTSATTSKTGFFILTPTLLMGMCGLAKNATATPAALDSLYADEGSRKDALGDGPMSRLHVALVRSMALRHDVATGSCWFWTKDSKKSVFVTPQERTAADRESRARTHGIMLSSIRIQYDLSVALVFTREATDAQPKRPKVAALDGYTRGVRAAPGGLPQAAAPAPGSAYAQRRVVTVASADGTVGRPQGEEGAGVLAVGIGGDSFALYSEAYFATGVNSERVKFEGIDVGRGHVVLTHADLRRGRSVVPDGASSVTAPVTDAPVNKKSNTGPTDAEYVVLPTRDGDDEPIPLGFDWLDGAASVLESDEARRGALGARRQRRAFETTADLIDRLNGTPDDRETRAEEMEHRDWYDTMATRVHGAASIKDLEKKVNNGGTPFRRPFPGAFDRSVPLYTAMTLANLCAYGASSTWQRGRVERRRRRLSMWSGVAKTAVRGQRLMYNALRPEDGRVANPTGHHNVVTVIVTGAPTTNNARGRAAAFAFHRLMLAFVDLPGVRVLVPDELTVSEAAHRCHKCNINVTVHSPKNNTQSLAGMRVKRCQNGHEYPAVLNECQNIMAYARRVGLATN